ncbi:Ig-like domain-containing protein [Mesonia aquimarina]|uniref:Ig-like domain-containing protein n=1 Tax=Mesonia aquimarina TaxID=1504967 RepID=UPI000EF5E2AC|nr:Ig-like domain-containing protein [Mesonia aquimarina]
MLKRFLLVFCFILLAANMYNCAKKGMPTGGALDTIPPNFVGASPENFSTNVTTKEIRINFNEYIKLEDAQEQIIVSPPLNPKPEISPLGSASKNIRIRISDTLKENTTYSINFGNSIVDNNEGNPFSYFRYVFSTGDYIDSLSISGTAINSLKREIEANIAVMLYEVDSTYTDSTIYKKPPQYIAYTKDSVYSFSVENMKAGTYQIVALKDNNNNYTYEPKSDKIGFLAEPIEVPTDNSFELKIFKEQLNFEIKRTKQLSKNHLIFGYEGKSEATSIDLLSTQPEEFDYRIIKDPDKDTLHYWHKPFIEQDSLIFMVSNKDYSDSLVVKIRDMESDSLEMRASPKAALAFDENFEVTANTPLEKIDADKISILDRDSLQVSFSTTKDNFNNKFIFNFKKEEDQQYKIKLLPGSFTDFYGNKNDTLAYSLKTKAYSELGNLNFTVENIQSYPIIVQVITEKDEVYRELIHQEKDGNKFVFNQLKPSTYYVRVIYDENNNGIWDTGSYLEKRQPEKVFYYPKSFTIRPNWDFSETFILK